MKSIINIMICLILFSLSGCIFTNPTTLDFGSNEVDKTFTLTAIGDVEWSIEYSESWITVEPDSGQGTNIITVTVDKTGLEMGNYEEQLHLIINKGCACVVTVEMEVSDSNYYICGISGGTVITALCCTSVGNFPILCLVGPCGCSPEYSHEVFICQCPEGYCWNGADDGCIPSSPPLKKE